MPSGPRIDRLDADLIALFTTEPHLGVLGASRPAAATNILLIVLDDLGSDKVSAYADERYPGHAPTYPPDTPTKATPARGGLRFSDDV